jgi:hypothetical protein
MLAVCTRAKLPARIEDKIRLVKRRSRLLLITGLLVVAIAGAVALLGYPPARRVAAALWLTVGDWLAAPRAPTRTARGVVIFEGSDAADREAWSETHGTVSRAPAAGGRALRLGAASTTGTHEACTRRVPGDWSAHAILRLELSAPDGGTCSGNPLPLKISVRLRGRPGWTGSSWYRHEVYLRPGATSHELSLLPARQRLDLRDVRQLCLALSSDARRATPSLELRRVLLTRSWAPPPRDPGPEPLSVRLLGDSTKLRRFDPLPPAHRARAAAGTFELHAARNEVIAFQVLIRRGSAGPSRARITTATLVGPDGYQLQPVLFEEQLLTVHQPSSAMYGPGSPGPGSYPDPLVPLGGPLTLRAGNRLVWVDLTVPADAPPGTYRSTVRVDAEGQLIERPISLEVHRAILPHDRRQLVMVYYDDHLLRRTLGLSGERFHAVERAYHELAHAHGAYLVTDPSLENMSRFLPMLSGSLYKDGPGRGQGAPYWPVDLMASTRPAVQAAAARTMRWFRSRGLRTQPFVYLSDEPATRAEYQRIRRMARWIKGAPPPGDKLPVMVTEQVAPDDPTWPSLTGAVDYWVSPLNFPQPAASRRRSSAERFFTYNGREPLSGSQLLDAAGVSTRTWGWIAFRYRFDLWFLWQGLYFRDTHNGGPPADVYREPITFDQRRRGNDEDFDFGNGDGVLFYPPRQKDGRPVPSLRLKMIRRGVQDRLYLLVAEACGHRDKARAIARALLPRALGEARGCSTSWPKQGEPWEAARRALLELIDACR